jgi:hypothetical protein
MAKKLTVFLSYASEDRKFADALETRISNCFKWAIDIKSMAHFPLGVNFRNLIDRALDTTDILLVIATGHEKLSHSFTGYEVGYFRSSQQARRYIAETQGIERLVIPIALLADIPDTLSDIEGIGIADNERFLLRADATGQAAEGREDRFFELLVRIDRILVQLDPVERTPERQMQDYSGYREQAVGFYTDLLKVMSSLPLRREMPKTKLTLRLPANFRSKDVELEGGVMLLCTGPTTGILQNPPSEQWISWQEFVAQIGRKDIALTWSDALVSLITSAVVGEFANSDPLVFSFDQKKLFRLFVSKSTTFFDRTRELDIYVVEILRDRDVGDPFTTYLAKAIAIALRYRALFLEGGSPYGAVTVRFWKKEEWKPMMREMLRDLRLLLMHSQEAGLGVRRHIIELYGPDDGSINRVLGMVDRWSRQKMQLYACVESILMDPDPSEASFEAFIRTIGEFCTETKAINVAFVTSVLKKLAVVLQVDQGEHNSGSVEVVLRSAGEAAA